MVQYLRRVFDDLGTRFVVCFALRSSGFSHLKRRTAMVLWWWLRIGFRQAGDPPTINFTSGRISCAGGPKRAEWWPLIGHAPTTNSHVFE